MTMMQEIIFNELVGEYGTIGEIVLNRPNKLNALNYTMITSILRQLELWEQDPLIKAVLVRSNSDKAFCAGGDLRIVYELGIDKCQQFCEFFQDEYKLNHYIKYYPKPYIVLLNGLTFGGGAGISLHGSHIIGTENLKLSMPETSIGLYPDVGASYFLSRCAGAIGMYLGLTGNIVLIEDALYCGLVNFYVKSELLQKLINKLLIINYANDPYSNITNAIQEFSATASSESQLKIHRQTIDRYFSKDNVQDIINSLQQLANHDSFAKLQLNKLNKCSPTSLKVTHRQLQVASRLTFDECIEMEYHLTKELMQKPDIYEGIRAVIIDKTRDPKWQPATIQAVKDSYIDQLFKKYS